MLATREFNKWIGRIIAGIVAALYAQFVTDVFMMIQLLKEPETDFMAVCFYFADASAGMIMMYDFQFVDIYKALQKTIRNNMGNF